MGVSISKIKANKSPIVDYGCVVPLGLYQQMNEQYDMKMIQQLIISRKLSPFYKGVSDPGEIDSFIDYSITTEKPTRKMDKATYYKLYVMNNQKKIFSLLYNNSIECPICFLYYPANINFTRCCDQPICTECFVQIKKGSADTSCPYCMTDKFGVIYQCPPPKALPEKKHQMRSTTSGLSINPYSKRKIIPSNHPAVVLLDHMKNMTSSSSSSNNNIQILFQARNVTSFDRYLSSISLSSLSVQDLMFIESIRNSMMIDKE